MASVVRLARINILPRAKYMTGQVTFVSSQRHNSNRASLKRLKQEYILRTYESLLVLPDGSSVRIRYEKPRRLLAMPANTAELLEQERIKRLYVLNPPERVEAKEEKEEYNISLYSKMVKNRK